MGVGVEGGAQHVADALLANTLLSTGTMGGWGGKYTVEKRHDVWREAEAR